MLAVDRPENKSHAADSSFIDHIPNPAARSEAMFATTTTTPPPPTIPTTATATATATTTTHTHSDSFDSMKRSFYDNMEDHDIISTKPDHHVVQDQAPILPKKSALRASRLLEGLVSLKLPEPTVQTVFTENPHDEYLSSEEDASSTAGDFSDFEYDSGSDDITPSPTKECIAQEVTARVVSVVFSGKPSMVDVPQVRRSMSPSSIERKQTLLDLTQKSNSDSEVKRRRMSTSTISSRSSSISKHQAVQPARVSSMLPLGPPQTKPFFLRIDPYANGSSYSLNTHGRSPESRQATEEERPKTPTARTPTKMFKGVARAMSLMKRRSAPRLNQSFLAPSSEHVAIPNSPSHHSIPEEPTDMDSPKSETRSEFTTTPPLPPSQLLPPRPRLMSTVSEDGLTTAKKNEKVDKHLSVGRMLQGEALESPISPISPLSATSVTTPTSSKRMSSLTFARRRMSVKLTGKFQL